MEATRITPSDVLRSSAIAIAVLISCMLLFSLDHKTKGVSDILNPGNIAALFIYAVPAFLICSLFDRAFIRQGKLNSLILSITLGIPLSFILTITALAFAMGRI